MPRFSAFALAGSLLLTSVAWPAVSPLAIAGGTGAFGQVALMGASQAAPRKAAGKGQAGIEKIGSDPASGISEYRLKSNGLSILLAERHATPIVTVMVVYKVGSRNEAVGYTGSTHFLEHMGFRGTAKHDPLKGTGIDDVLKPIGGINNATTWYDRTNYFEIVPAKYMDVCLELEADRMRGELLRESDRKSEMTVVRNELERNEDDPSRLLDVNVFATAFREHPYHHPVIGWRSDVENVPIERLRKFYNDFYHPGNATLVVIGDFKTSDALAQIEKYFAPLKASPQTVPSVYTVEPEQQGERRFVVQRGDDLPKVMIGFHIPKATSSELYPLDVVASLLGDEKRQSSRLYKAIIDKGLASDCYAFDYSLKDPGLFTVFATATPGTSLPTLEKAIEEELEKLGREQVSAEELEKAKKADWKRMKLDAADPSGMAGQLAEAIAVADWRWWTKLESNIKAVTAADVQRVAGKYFSKRNRTVGYYYPAKGEPGDSKPEDGKSKEAPADNTEPKKDGLLSLPAQAAELAPAVVAQAAAPAQTASGRRTIASQVKKIVMPNGLTLLVMPVPGSGVVSVAGKITGGEYYCPDTNCHVAELMAEMLDKGSKKWSKEDLARQLENLGSSMDFHSGNFWMQFQSDMVSEDVPTYLSLLSDVLQNPQFAGDELEKVKTIKDAEIRSAMADTGQVAANVLATNLYSPGCVYYEKPFDKQLEELKAVTAADLSKFHKEHVRAGDMVLAVVGDIDQDKAVELVKQNFGNWEKSSRSTIAIDNCTPLVTAKGRRIDTTLKDKTNVDIVLGVPADVSIKSKDFYAASIANAALGHDTIASRLAELRNKYGMTYGIRSGFEENAYSFAPWVIDFSVAPENVAKSLPIVRKIVDDYRSGGITPAELNDEAKRLAGEYIVARMRTPKQLADAISKYEILGLGAEFMDQYPDRLSRVTKPEVDAAIKRYFRIADALTSLAGSVPGKAK